MSLRPAPRLLLRTAEKDCLSKSIDCYLRAFYSFFFVLFNENEGINIALVLTVIPLKVKYDGTWKIYQ